MPLAQSLGRAVLLAAVVLFGAVAAAQAQPLRTAHVETELISTQSAVAPGETVTLGLRQAVAAGWHTYWINPGDSGEPTRLTWTLPPGYAAGPLQHPAPDIERLENVVTFVHRGEVIYPIELTVPANARPGRSAALRAHAFFLVCSNICVTEEGDVELTLPIAAQARRNEMWAPRIEAAIAAIPRDVGLAAHVTGARLTIAGAPLADAAAGGGLRNIAFFPFAQDVIVHSAPQRPSYGAQGVSFDLAAGIDGPLGQSELAGVLAFERRSGEGWAREAYQVRATPGEALPETSGAAPPSETETPPAPPLTELPLQILFALLGGLILNVMPCVLPVLAIKAVAIAQGTHAGRARRDGVFYFAGVLATFLALALIIIALRSTGEALGWAFQLQEPWLVALLALLFYAIGLNFIGAYEISAPTGLGQSLASRADGAGAFFTGALAVVAASPCLGPFMAGAVGFALASPPPVTLIVFAALATGFALPILVLSFAPALQRLIPKPGAWMIRFRQALAFAMFAAAVWLAWVLTVQTGAGGALALLSIAVALSFVILTLRWGRLWIAAALAALALVSVLFWAPLTTPAAASEEANAILPSEPWSVARVDALRAEGRPIFVNFTAAWCVQCQVNEFTTFRSPHVAEAFRNANVAYLKADWTSRNSEIAAEIARRGAAGIPLYLYFAPGAESPLFLSPNLNEAELLNAIAGGS